MLIGNREMSRLNRRRLQIRAERLCLEMREKEEQRVSKIKERLAGLRAEDERLTQQLRRLARARADTDSKDKVKAERAGIRERIAEEELALSTDAEICSLQEAFARADEAVRHMALGLSVCLFSLLIDRFARCGI